MRIIVADDEYYARFALTSILTELTADSTEFVEVENGEELIDRVEKDIPDLIFLDIKMPKVGGLEAFSILKKRFPDILWVIVSGYADFSYARQALVLGAREYLMKPVSEEEVKKVLIKIYAELEEGKDKLVRLFSSDMGLFLSYGQPCDNLEECAYAATILYQTGRKMIQQTKIVAQRLRKLCVRSQETVVRHGTVTLTDGSLALISAVIRGNEAEMLLEKSQSDIMEQFGSIKTETEKWNSFQTGFCRSAEELNEKLNDISIGRSYVVLMKAGQNIGWRQIKRLEEQKPELIKFCSAVEAMAAEFQNRDYALFSRDAKTAIKILKEGVIQLSAAMQENLYAFLLETVGEKAKEVFKSYMKVRSVEAWENFTQDCEKLLLTTRGIAAGQPIAEKIASYIRGHYESGISVGQVAEQFEITPNYLSTLFKNEMGVSFVQYLTEIRMVKAKELLACKEMTIGAVAEKLGYQNAAYFTKVFRENTGLYPTEFRKQVE